MKQSLRDLLVAWKKVNESVSKGYLIAQFGPHSDYKITTYELIKELKVSVVETILYLQFAFNAMKVLKLTQEWLKKVDTAIHKNDVGLYDLERKINYVLDFIDEGDNEE